MRTNSQKTVSEITSILRQTLGLVGHDAERLAKRINKGTNGRSVAEYVAVLENACRETLASGQKFLVVASGMDLLVYTERGYAIIDHTAGWLDFAYTYRAGKTFDTETKFHRDTIAIAGMSLAAPVEYLHAAE